jgi:hypothetical protein
VAAGSITIDAHVTGRENILQTKGIDTDERWRGAVDQDAPSQFMHGGRAARSVLSG